MRITLNHFSKDREEKIISLERRDSETVLERAGEIKCIWLSHDRGWWALMVQALTGQVKQIV